MIELKRTRSLQLTTRFDVDDGAAQLVAPVLVE
jgi:hypothetical protein